MFNTYMQTHGSGLFEDFHNLSTDATLTNQYLEFYHFGCIHFYKLKNKLQLKWNRLGFSSPLTAFHIWQSKHWAHARHIRQAINISPNLPNPLLTYLNTSCTRCFLWPGHCWYLPFAHPDPLGSWYGRLTSWTTSTVSREAPIGSLRGRLKGMKRDKSEYFFRWIPPSEVTSKYPCPLPGHCPSWVSLLYTHTLSGLPDSSKPPSPRPFRATAVSLGLCTILCSSLHHTPTWNKSPFR